MKSFAISAAITGFAGVLFARKLSFIGPMLPPALDRVHHRDLIGGTVSLHGAVLGAIFLVADRSVPDLSPRTTCPA